RSLNQLGTVPKEALPALVDSLRYMYARTEAAEALANLGDEGFAELVKAARSSDSGIRSAVASALDECGVKAVPILIRLAKDPSYPVRDRAVRSLGNIGP
ncbi:unnamed protein product, partial [marine sediment metagenome]